MRPEDFSPGNLYANPDTLASQGRFNEAGGFLPRKLPAPQTQHALHDPASMRPEDFSPGNLCAYAVGVVGERRFNEAGGFLPRKHGAIPGRRCGSPSFNEAGGFLPRKHKTLENSLHWWNGFNEAGGFLPRKHRPVDGQGSDSSPASMRPEDFSPGNPDASTSRMYPYSALQ